MPENVLPELLDVPVVDAAVNRFVQDVVGNKLDTVAGDSLVALFLQAIAAAGGGVLPAPDAAANAAPADIPGNKLDTVAGNSLYSRALQLLARLVLPGADSANNVTPADVLGQKGDSVAGDSVYALQLQILAAIAGVSPVLVPSAQLVYPDITAAYVVLTEGVPPAYGAYVQIVPAATITNDFIITQILFDKLTWGQNRVYSIQLAYGAADTVCGTVLTQRLTDGGGIYMDMPVSTPIIPANSRIRARLAMDGGGAEQVAIRVAYREV